MRQVPRVGRRAGSAVVVIAGLIGWVGVRVVRLYGRFAPAHPGAADGSSH